ncbi:glycerate kinase [Olivibacter sp. CPCC 100613]|uniref:glycerate kinase family protein n=1 Tax=Olivibacter sp. CPCC 100613 TaxID=3079931 RepID=UPI002FF48B29
MQILIAPNAFKNSLPADQVATALAAGLKESSLPCSLCCFPIGDGGDGTVELLISHLGLKSIAVDTVDPFGRPIKGKYGYDPQTATAYIEMADASGIRLLATEELNPMQANSVGTGWMLKDALDQGAKHVVLGLGGSATVDGACGMLSALGVEFLDKEGNALKVFPQQLLKLDKIDVSGLDERMKYCQFTVLTDVKNRLLGKKGAAFVFGPQKGASSDEVEVLDDFLEHLNCVWSTQLGKDAGQLAGGGAAGGVAAGLWAVVDAAIMDGIDYFLESTGFDEELKKANLLITGEGSIDLQTLDGKGPFGVAHRAKSLQIPTIGVGGAIPLAVDERLAAYFDVLIPINHHVAPFDELKICTFENLRRTGKLIGELLQLGLKKTVK